MGCLGIINFSISSDKKKTNSATRKLIINKLLSLGSSKKGSEEEEEVLVCLATASPAKFAETIQSALITVNPTNRRLEDMKMLHKNHPRPAKHTLRRGDDWNIQLRQIIAEI